MGVASCGGILFLSAVTGNLLRVECKGVKYLLQFARERGGDSASTRTMTLTLLLNLYIGIIRKQKVYVLQ